MVGGGRGGRSGKRHRDRGRERGEGEIGMKGGGGVEGKEENETE